MKTLLAITVGDSCAPIIRAIPNMRSGGFETQIPQLLSHQLPLELAL